VESQQGVKFWVMACPEHHAVVVEMEPFPCFYPQETDPGSGERQAWAGTQEKDQLGLYCLYMTLWHVGAFGSTWQVTGDTISTSGY
jgi:hypothetical protein